MGQFCTVRDILTPWVARTSSRGRHRCSLNLHSHQRLRSAMETLLRLELAHNSELSFRKLMYFFCLCSFVCSVLHLTQNRVSSRRVCCVCVRFYFHSLNSVTSVRTSLNHGQEERQKTKRHDRQPVYLPRRQSQKCRQKCASSKRTNVRVS